MRRNRTHHYSGSSGVGSVPTATQTPDLETLQRLLGPHVNYSTLAESADLSRSYVSRVLRGRENASRKTLVLIAQAVSNDNSVSVDASDVLRYIESLLCSPSTLE